MIKNKKIFTVLSTTAITGLLVAAVNSSAFAKASTIAVNSSDGKVYEYQYDALKASAVSQLMNGANDPGSKLYNDFSQRKTSVEAYYDDVRKSYVSFDVVAKEAVNSMIKGISFDLNSFMESTTTPTTTIITNPVSIDVSGNLLINGQTATSPKVTGIYSSTNKYAVVIYFSEAMNTAELTNKDNYTFVNGQGDTRPLPSDTTLTFGEDHKSVIINFPSSYNVLTNSDTTNGSSTDITKLIVSNVTDEAGNKLENVSFSSKIKATITGTNVKDNSIKIYYDKDDLKVDVRFTRAIDTINPNDFTLGGVTPNSVSSSGGDKVTLKFNHGELATASEVAAHPITYANGKINSNPTKIEVIKSQGQSAKFAINSTTTTDETGARVSINDDGSAATLSKSQSTIYDYQSAPRTTSNYWSATKDSTGGTVYITFDTILDSGSARSDNFIFFAGGTELKANSASAVGNTLVFKFNTTNKNYSSFTNLLNVTTNSSTSIRNVIDADGNYAIYAPSDDDLKTRDIVISK